ncbi:hypothetical protein BIW11_03910 [Tropilaelaps mercedesae]|uniref:Uncharacterized protein n=1 Tax=Tropilaelaps mercedesae TaxID=418985 RepID=A0A1V9XEH6_9ACAR|nr:hypothetical protein BIW11_03910 [Tropilaelaps mercedesae]
MDSVHYGNGYTTKASGRVTVNGDIWVWAGDKKQKPRLADWLKRSAFVASKKLSRSPSRPDICPLRLNRCPREDVVVEGGVAPPEVGANSRYNDGERKAISPRHERLHADIWSRSGYTPGILGRSLSEQLLLPILKADVINKLETSSA